MTNPASSSSQDFDTASLRDRIHGGWLGRVAGCVLGKPVEMGWSKSKLDTYLQMAASLPLTDYIPRLETLPSGFELNAGGNGCCRGEVHGAPADDDTDYTILGLHILETYGLDFTTADVAHEWLEHLPYYRTWTAERAAYRNLVLGISPHHAAGLFNPGREYIGARIRVDAYGLFLPGMPALAADLARRDASLTHKGEGIYSAMFMAACIARAFVSRKVEEIIQGGLEVIPQYSRTAVSVRETMAEHTRSASWESAYDHLLEKYAGHPPVHAINNTVCLTLALLYGECDFERTICIAVRCGLDTDCNAANAGTVLGVLTGAQTLPGKWINPLNDTLQSWVSGFGVSSISDLSRRTAVLASAHLSDHLIKE